MRRLSPVETEHGKQSRRVRYGAALLSVLLALLATLALHTIAPQKPFAFAIFFVAIAFSAAFGGFWPGVVATLASTLFCVYFFLPPIYTLIVEVGDLPLVALFVLSAFLIIGVSERMRAGVRAADARFHDLVQGLDAIVWEANAATGAFSFVSRRAEQILGYPVKDWLNSTDFRARIVYHDDAERVESELHEALSKTGVRAIEYRAVAADGRTPWLRETLHVVRNLQGDLVRLSGLCVDITARKAAAEELAAAKDELAALNGITSAVGASLDLPTVIGTLERELSDRLGVTSGFLLLDDIVSGDFRLAASWGEPESMPRLLQAAGSGTGEGQAIAPGELTVAEGIRSFLLSAESGMTEWNGYLAVPLLSSGEIHGWMGLKIEGPGAVSHARGAFFETLGRQLGVIFHNARLFQQVRIGHERLQQLSRQLVNVQEGERRAIARELHDEIGQLLTGLKLSLEMSSRVPGPAGEAGVAQALSLVNDLMNHVHDLSLDLRPSILDDLGLLPALLWHFNRFTTVTGINVIFQHADIDRRFPQEVETAAYRIVQEALTNVARHAGVDTVTVRLWAAREMLGIQIADTGKGFNAQEALAAATTGGLPGMEERATLLGGNLTIESDEQHGTCVTAELPITSPEGEPKASGQSTLVT
jgi:PAS domain S-box-containing protein